MLSVLLFISGSCKKNETIPPVGEPYKGGKVFYIDNTGQHGLVAANADLGTGSPWGCKGVAIVGADGTSLGTGNQNTIDIATSCSEAGTAAKLCSDLVLDGYSDWYLPSKEELNLLYQQRTLIGGFAKDTYWSSSEVNTICAWIQSFDTGTQFGTTTKDYGTNLRPIRAF
ncbi:MAG: DUF1566 domain-containing protein [Bacteroidetes bacterium]|nr:DUF1566 domain-containing protein [Bacteroidota bacterium]